MAAIEGNRALLYDNVGLREDFDTGKDWADLYVESKELVKKKKRKKIGVLFLCLLPHNILSPKLDRFE